MFPVQHVLLPALTKMGASISMNVVKFGFYPDIKGRVDMKITALQQPLQAISLVERGSEVPTKLIIRVKPSDS